MDGRNERVAFARVGEGVARHVLQRVARDRDRVRRDGSRHHDGVWVQSGFRIDVEDENPGPNAGVAHVRMAQGMRAVVARNEMGPPKVGLPAVPDGLRNGERRSDGARVHAELELEHHLVEGALEHVGDVGTLDALGQPSIVLLQHLREAVFVETQRVAKVLNGLAVRAVEVHRLDFENAETVDADAAVGVRRQLDERRVERQFGRAIRGAHRDLAAELVLEVDDRQIVVPRVPDDVFPRGRSSQGRGGGDQHGLSWRHPEEATYDAFDQIRIECSIRTRQPVLSVR